MTLPEHLLFQLQCCGISDEETRIGEYIIESLDENGYVASSAKEMAEAVGVSEEEVLAMLSVIQTFDPLGVGAAGCWQECLLIQLRQQGQLTEIFELVIRDHLKDLAENRLGIIAREMGDLHWRSPADQRCDPHAGAETRQTVRVPGRDKIHRSGCYRRKNRRRIRRVHK